MSLVIFIRFFLSALLLIGIFFEAGIFTAFSFGLIVITVELINWRFERIEEILRGQHD